MNRVGDLVKCIWQPRMKFEDMACSSKNRETYTEANVFIKNEIGIIVKEESNDRYLISFAHLGYKHILFKGAFVNVSEIERERNEFSEVLNNS